MKAACCGKLTDVRVEGILEKLLVRRTNLRSVCVVVTVETHGVHVPNVRLTVSSHVAEARDLLYPLPDVAKPDLAETGSDAVGRWGVLRPDGRSASRYGSCCGGLILLYRLLCCRQWHGLTLRLYAPLRVHRIVRAQYPRHKRPAYL